ncbi:DNA polymerase III subunit alpha [Candidatus Peregrinibacteria bacterium]|nr:DNA polymerase III subunit alpha [Candidatus Peregrinibacteria bacterium]
MPEFIHLHVHSHYSLLDGLGKPADIVAKAKQQGAGAVAITDHGVLYGAIEFYREAEKAGIKPIIGVEAYISPTSRFDKIPGPENKPYHIVLLAKDADGYRNLMELTTKAHLEGFYYKPRIDFGLLKAHSKGLVALTACLAGEIPRLILNNNEEKIESSLKNYKEIFGEGNFYLEMQDHPEIENQMIVNHKIIELSKKFNIPLVATNDAHYVSIKDKEVHDVLLCIQTGKSVGDEDRMHYEGDYSLRSPEEMWEAFKETPEALTNTLKIADQCNLKIEFNQNLLPSFSTPQNEPAKQYLKTLCEEGLQKKYKEEERAEALKRLEYELDVVDKMGFNTYFLIVHDFVKYAKDNGILVGPGRGSAAGSIIAYTLNITELDPLAYGLLFERFLNPARVSMPDIDIDFADSRRDEVLAYVIQKYGRENVAQIITFGTMTAKAVVRDTGRGLGYPYDEVDRIAKLVPPTVLGKHKPLSYSVENDPDLNAVYNSDERAQKLLDIASRLDGTVRHAGTHACAVVISEQSLINYTPLQRSPTDENAIITQYSMKPIEQIGLLKMDFLGLKNLTILETAIKIVKRTKGLDIKLSEIPLDDKKTFELLQRGETLGVFQLESPGMTRYLQQLKPTHIEDIIAMISLYRPGPMEWIPSYIKGKRDPSKVKYLDSSFVDILNETYGVAIYQEQILQIARKFAGFTLGEADILRKAVGKKIPALLHEQMIKFVDGSVKMGHKKEFAQEVFEKVIEPFAGYGFNKAHAASYALISYNTAYMKAYFPTEFMTALMSCDYGNTDKIVVEIFECNKMGIAVLPPSVNESFANFTYVDDKKIRFGLAAIKGIGSDAAQVIIDIRADKPFKTFEEFASRVPQKILNKKLIEAMAYSGGFDDLGDRKQIAESTDEISNFAKFHHQNIKEDQTDIFGILEESGEKHEVTKLKLKKIEPATNTEKLKWEKQYLGLYVSAHPLQGLTKYFAKKAHLIRDLKPKNIGKKLIIGGIISMYKKIFTKSGAYMASFKIEDPTGKLDVIVFPKTYQKFGHLFQDDVIVVMTGELSDRRGIVQFVVDEAKVIDIESMIANAKRDKLYNPEEIITIVTPNFLKTAKKDEENEIQDELTPHNPDELSEEVFIININEQADAGKLAKIKDLLLNNKGETPCEIHIKSDNRIQKVKLPFGIQADQPLKDSLSKLLA